MQFSDTLLDLASPREPLLTRPVSNPTMRRRLILSLITTPLLLVALPLQAHDMFCRLSAWFVAPGQQVVLPVLNR